MADEVKYISLAELAERQEQLVGFNPEADANASIPPIPAQDYVMKLSFQEAEMNKRWMQTVTKGKGGVGGGKTYFFANIVAEVAENPQNPEKYWGRKVFHRAQTLILEDTGTNGVQAIMQGLGKGERLKNVSQTHGKLAALLTEELQSNPLVITEIDWEARRFVEGQPEKDAKVKGYKKFPLFDETDPHSIRNHVVTLADGDTIEARAIVAKWKPISKLTGVVSAAAAPVVATSATVVAHTPPKPQAAATAKK